MDSTGGRLGWTKASDGRDLFDASGNVQEDLLPGDSASSTARSSTGSVTNSSVSTAPLLEQLPRQAER